MESAKKTVQEELMQLGKDWDKAIVANDAEAIGRFMSADWVIVGTEGGITGKEKFLEFIRAGDLLHEKMEFDDIRVKVYDNAAIITSRGTSAGTYKGNPFSYFEWSTSVFTRENDSWICVYTMLTPAQVPG